MEKYGKNNLTQPLIILKNQKILRTSRTMVVKIQRNDTTGPSAMRFGSDQTLKVLK